MRYKIIILLLITVILLFVFRNKTATKHSLIQNKTSITPVNEVQKRTRKEESKTTVLANQKIIPASAQPLSNKELEIYEQIVKELDILDKQQYPTIIQELKYQLFQCAQLNKYNYLFANSPELYSSQQKSTYQQSKSKCQTITQKYKYLSSVLNSSRSVNILQRLLNSEDNTDKNLYEFNHIPSKEEQYEFTNNMIQYFIDSESPYLLENVILNQRRSQYLVKNTTISELLGSYNIDYISMINKQALTLLSCKFKGSVTCDESSLFMLSECFNNEEACGLSVKEWFNYAFTDAHLNDIDKVIAYYLSA